MSDECAAMLKGYAALFQMTQGEVLYEAARTHIHKMAQGGCKGTCALLDMNGIALDKRAHKECYGAACKACKHNKACRIGKHQGNFECDARWENLLPDEEVAFDPASANQIASINTSPRTLSHSSPVHPPRFTSKGGAIAPHIAALFGHHEK